MVAGPNPMPVDDRWRLDRFVDAQNPVIDDVYRELGQGHKSTHWMWFVFPQLKDLGRSTTARHFGIAGTDEALAYWQHPVLGDRLKRCCDLLLKTEGLAAMDIFGSVDAMKLRSSMTLFTAAVPGADIFLKVLAKLLANQQDPLTLGLLKPSADIARPNAK